LFDNTILFTILSPRGDSFPLLNPNSRPTAGTIGLNGGFLELLNLA